MVLCTVPDPQAMIREVTRVLRPDGTILFLEHVRSGSPRLARWQDRLEIPWRWLGHGCRCNQRTEAMLRWSQLELDWLEHDEIPRITPLVKPLIVGAAHRASAAPVAERSDELAVAS
jgi:ubiquinone/menaquinone biosynthesis C-methylase UbiE